MSTRPAVLRTARRGVAGHKSVETTDSTCDRMSLSLCDRIHQKYVMYSVDSMGVMSLTNQKTMILQQPPVGDKAQARESRTAVPPCSRQKRSVGKPAASRNPVSGLHEGPDSASPGTRAVGSTASWCYVRFWRPRYRSRDSKRTVYRRAFGHHGWRDKDGQSSIAGREPSCSSPAAIESARGDALRQTAKDGGLASQAGSPGNYKLQGDLQGVPSARRPKQACKSTAACGWFRAGGSWLNQD